MKRKITYVILLFFLISIISAILTECGRNAEAEDEEGSFWGNSYIESLSEEDNAERDREGSVREITTEDRDTDEKERADDRDTITMPLSEKEVDWITLEENLRPSILQISCGGYGGSGVVWEITEEEVTVVSSGHLLKNGETCDVVCYAGVYYEAEVERILEDCDIGFAVFSSKALEEDGVELKEVALCGREKDKLVQGEEIAVYGSMDYVAGNFVKGYLIEAEKEMQLDGYSNAEGLLLGGIVQENVSENSDHVSDAGEEGHTNDRTENEKTETDKKGMVDAGMSGSGVFDRQGRLLGILAGGDGKYGFAAVPVWKFAER